MGTVFTKVVKDRPLPRVKVTMEVEGRKARAVTLTSGTCGGRQGRPGLRDSFEIQVSCGGGTHC